MLPNIGLDRKAFLGLPNLIEIELLTLLVLRRYLMGKCGQGIGCAGGGRCGQGIGCAGGTD